MLLILLNVALHIQPSEIRAEVTSDILLFPQIDSTHRWNVNNVPGTHDFEFVPGIDLFATFGYKNFSFLVEYLLNTEEQELERIQLGWLFSDTKVWLGRFHNPIGYWNTQFHHGSFLETSISRPAIVEFEDDGGLLPAHLAGLFIEGAYALKEQGIGYALGLALGPEFSGGLEPWDALSPSSGDHDISAVINIYYEPVIYAPTRFGIFLNYTEIPAEGHNFSDVHQFSSGIYGNWEAFPWRLIGSAFYIYNDFKGPTHSADDAFFNAYLQTEYSLNNRWTIFGRLEGTLSGDNDAYLELNPEFIKDRILGGIRYNHDAHNAIKLEISKEHREDDDFGQLMLQWSAFF